MLSNQAWNVNRVSYDKGRSSDTLAGRLNISLMSQKNGWDDGWDDGLEVTWDVGWEVGWDVGWELVWVGLGLGSRTP